MEPSFIGWYKNEGSMKSFSMFVLSFTSEKGFMLSQMGHGAT